MNDLALSLRQARPSDAADLARIYIESWQDTYAGILPHSLLAAMSLKTHTIRWQSQMRGAGLVLVAEDRNHGVVGLSSLGGARDSGLGFEGEVYTLYVDPAFFGRGVGRKLLHGAFAALKERKFHSCLIWSHARNNACYFYEAMGGQRVAERVTRLAGEPTPEVAFGWKRLATSSRRLAI
ncbi:MAG TPA: GNAT family N-acetyltransferase [Rhizomicrobium sp.]|nr:GNAT family N-acetyltransferase [Rhizomicrobium sp.]